MKTGFTLLVTAVLGAAAAMSPATFAESCSGGSDHGMDATGNECGMTTQTADQIDPSLWTAIAARLASPRTEQVIDHAPLAGAIELSTSGALMPDAPALAVPAGEEHPIP